MLLVPVTPPVRFEGGENCVFFGARFLNIFGCLPLRRCVSLRFHVFLAPARPSISATLSWREPNKRLPFLKPVLNTKPWDETALHTLALFQPCWGKKPPNQEAVTEYEFSELPPSMPDELINRVSVKTCLGILCRGRMCVLLDIPKS